MRVSKLALMGAIDPLDRLFRRLLGVETKVLVEGVIRQ